jgi:hypothetical protein
VNKQMAGEVARAKTEEHSMHGLVAADCASYALRYWRHVGLPQVADGACSSRDRAAGGS